MYDRIIACFLVTVSGGLTAKVEWLKPLILQGGYGPVDEKIDDVKKASENLERALQLCEHKKLDSIQHNTEDTRRDIAALKNLFLQFLRVQFHNTAWLVDLQSQNQGRREISNKDVPPKEYISQSELLLSIQPTSSTVEEIGSQRTVTERVLRAGYATGKGKQARAEWLMRDETGAVGEWFKSGCSRAILVNGNSYVERISSLSFFCAMLIRSLKALKRIIVLDHFCGLHTASDGLDNELCGSLGLLRNLTCQLAAQWRFGELSCVDDEQVATIKSEGRDMGPRQLWRLFQTLVEALPPMTPLFIFIDGISYYETDELSRDTKKLARAIMRLVRDSNVNAVVKVLFTSPHRALDMADILDENETVWIPKNPSGTRLGSADTQFRLAFGQMIERMEESGRRKGK
ncbi:hypothetical protein SAMD00023353_5300250 [Rosellinia necatrix]|uniref:Uncharacterized protein n=1 Tax=Rosellinia necatrix TaxID=77044 RepID=A0A1S8A9Y1_ROSNE|nr:hypothetical protein SAMD00023353_5300250 [Rosellinia necatrix]